MSFYTFLRKLEEYQRILGDKKTVLLLSSHRDLFDLLFKPPNPENATAGSRPPSSLPHTEERAGTRNGKQPAKSGGE